MKLQEFFKLRSPLKSKLQWNLILLMASVEAHGMVLSEFGAINFSLPSNQSSQNPNLSTAPGLSFGGGISLSFRIYKQIDLESGLIYVNRSFSTSSPQLDPSHTSFSTTQIPLLARYWLNDYTSLGLGPYWAHGVGNVTVSSTSQSSLLSFSDLGWAVDDYGIQISVRYMTPISLLVNFIVDARINAGLTDLETTTHGTLRFCELQSWVGIALVL